MKTSHLNRLTPAAPPVWRHFAEHQGQTYGVSYYGPEWLAAIRALYGQVLDGTLPKAAADELGRLVLIQAEDEGLVKVVAEPTRPPSVFEVFVKFLKARTA